MIILSIILKIVPLQKTNLYKYRTRTLSLITITEGTEDLRLGGMIWLTKVAIKTKHEERRRERESSDINTRLWTPERAAPSLFRKVPDWNQVSRRTLAKSHLALLMSIVLTTDVE